MSIIGVDEVIYGAEDVATGGRFFRDWGLTQTAERADRIEFETLNGGRVVVAAREARDLPAAIEPGSTLREAVWGVGTSADLAGIRARLVEMKAPLEESPGRVRTVDPNGFAVSFQVSPRRTVEVSGCPVNAWGDARRLDRPATIYERAQPVEIGHVVFFTNRLEEAERFYTGLGFVVSDRHPGHGVFLRSAARGGHHDLFLLRLPQGRTGLNHVAFTVRDIHEVFGGGMHISRCGWETEIGPGRHPVSSAYFWYVKSPCGGLAEYYADEDELTASWTPREFAPGPTVFAEWAIAGGIDGNTRRQKNAAPPPQGKFISERS